MPDHIGVGQAVRLDTGDTGIAVEGIEGVEQRLAGLVLELPFHRAHPAIGVAHPAVADVEPVQHAVTTEPVMGAPGREMRVRTVPVVSDIQPGWKLPTDDGIRQIAFHP